MVETTHTCHIELSRQLLRRDDSGIVFKTLRRCASLFCRFCVQSFSQILRISTHHVSPNDQLQMFFCGRGNGGAEIQLQCEFRDKNTQVMMLDEPLTLLRQNPSNLAAYLYMENSGAAKRKKPEAEPIPTSTNKLRLLHTGSLCELLDYLRTGTRKRDIATLTKDRLLQCLGDRCEYLQ